MAEFTHFDAAGHAHMVDVSEKPVTSRTAVASGCVKMSSQTLEMIAEGRAKKGDVLAVARLAGIMALRGQIGHGHYGISSFCGQFHGCKQLQLQVSLAFSRVPS